MSGTRILVAALAALLAGGTVGAVGLPEEGEIQGRHPPAVADPRVPPEVPDMGRGEALLLVVGGVFSTEAEAEAAAEPFGELQGYYVAPVAQFAGLADHLGAQPTDHVLVSAFRTERGAREFIDLAVAAGTPAMLTPRLVNRGGGYVGLGQEAAPDGTGPLRGPLAGVTTP